MDEKMEKMKATTLPPGMPTCLPMLLLRKLCLAGKKEGTEGVRMNAFHHE